MEQQPHHAGEGAKHNLAPYSLLTNDGAGLLRAQGGAVPTTGAPTDAKKRHGLRKTKNKKREEARVLFRMETKQRLARNLETLSSYCQPGVNPQDDVARDGWVAGLLRGVFGSYKFGCWPMRGLLREIEDDVVVLALHQRKTPIFPVWKAFEQVDKRMPKLRLKLRVDNLICRAREMLPSESELGKTLRQVMKGQAAAQCSLADMVLQPQKAVELLQQDRRMVMQRCMAQPLVCWAIEILHPMAKDLHDIVEFFATVKEMNAEHRREINRERQRRFRFRQKRAKKVRRKALH